MFQRFSTVFASVAATSSMGIYVAYRDSERYRLIANVFAKGSIIEPMKENVYEVNFFPRDEDPEVRRLDRILESNFCNQYHFVMGEVGTGKTRLLVEIVRDKIKKQGSEHKGAPVYILASQGKSFPDSFAEAIKFKFDEHISLKFFANALFKVDSFPKRDDHHKLERVLNALEKAAFLYTKKHGRPAVVVIDDVDFIYNHMPTALEKLQEKAKLWADANIVKMVFVANDEKVEGVFQKSYSSWSRAAAPVYIRDLSEKDARTFMKFRAYDNMKDIEIEGEESAFTSEETIKTRCKRRRLANMPDEYVEEVVGLVGGRLNHLLEFKLDWLAGMEFEDTASRLKEKELVNFQSVNRRPRLWKVFDALIHAPECQMQLTVLMDKSHQDDVLYLAECNILKIERAYEGMVVKFQSRLTRRVLEELYQINGKRFKPRLREINGKALLSRA